MGDGTENPLDLPQAGTDPAPAPAPATEEVKADPEADEQAQLDQWNKEQAEYQEKKAAHISNLKAKWENAKGGLHSDLKEFLEALLASHLGAFQD